MTNPILEEYENLTMLCGEKKLGSIAEQIRGQLKSTIEKALSDNVFILCETPDCFALHEMSQIAGRIQICHRVRKTGVRVNWD